MGNIENKKSSDALNFNTLTSSALTSSALKKSGALILLCLLSGCALFPPPPAQCSGQFKPVNVPVEKNTTIQRPAIDNNIVGAPHELHSEEGAADGK